MRNLKEQYPRPSYSLLERHHYRHLAISYRGVEWWLSLCLSDLDPVCLHPHCVHRGGLMAWLCRRPKRHVLEPDEGHHEGDYLFLWISSLTVNEKVVGD